MPYRERQCHLGDVCGEPGPALLPPLYLPRQHRPDLIQSAVMGVAYATTALIIVGLILAWLMMSMSFRSKLFAMDVPHDPYEKLVFNDCYTDALRYCKQSFFSGRLAIIECMLEHRGLLREQCSRHLFDNERKSSDALP